MNRLPPDRGEHFLIALFAGAVIASFALIGAVLVIFVMVLHHVGWL